MIALPLFAYLDFSVCVVQFSKCWFCRICFFWSCYFDLLSSPSDRQLLHRRCLYCHYCEMQGLQARQLQTAVSSSSAPPPPTTTSAAIAASLPVSVQPVTTFYQPPAVTASSSNWSALPSTAPVSSSSAQPAFNKVLYQSCCSTVVSVHTYHLLAFCMSATNSLL